MLFLLLSNIKDHTDYSFFRDNIMFDNNFNFSLYCIVFSIFTNDTNVVIMMYIGKREINKSMHFKVFFISIMLT